MAATSLIFHYSCLNIIYLLWIKSYLLIATAALFAISFSSCNKCQDCECYGDTEEVCEDDYDNKDDYKADIALAEAFGCTCK